jgi:hypothetical protein
MRGYLFACVPLLLLSAQPAVYAKERSSDRRARNAAQEEKSGGMFGAIAGGIAGSALGGFGAPRPWRPARLPVGSLLTDAIIRKLDCKEQVQAATATDTAVRGGVGTTSTWESDTRPGVVRLVDRAPRSAGVRRRRQLHADHRRRHRRRRGDDGRQEDVPQARRRQLRARGLSRCGGRLARFAALLSSSWAQAAVDPANPTCPRELNSPPTRRCSSPSRGDGLRVLLAEGAIDSGVPPAPGGAQEIRADRRDLASLARRRCARGQPRRAS